MDFYVISPAMKWQDMDLMRQGDRIFVLAHLYLKYKNYANYVRSCRTLGYFITLDNSAAEKSLVTEDALIEVVKDLMPNEVISPDVLFNKEETMSNLHSFIERMDKEGLSSKVNIFAVPQGKDLKAWKECYNEMLYMPEVKVIGLSKIAVPFAFLKQKNDRGIMEARHMCYDYLKENDLLKKPIHLLGAGNPTEFLYYDHPMIRSTDSCFSVWSAMNQQEWFKGHFDRIPTPHDYFERELSHGERDLAESNIRFLQTVTK